jgi:predicted MFS family arabinose efflux permease
LNAENQIALVVVTGTLLTAIIEYFASNLWMYAMSRFTFGLTRVCVTVANGMACDLVTESKDRSKAMGKNFSAIGVGFLLGSAIGGVVASPVNNYHLASLLNLTLATISFLWTFLLLKETHKPEKENGSNKNATKTDAKMSLLGALREILSNPDLRSLFLFHSLVLICNISPQHAYFEFIRTELALPTSLRGLFLVAIGIASVAAQSTFSLVVAKIGTARFVYICVIGTAITTFLAPLSGIVLFSITTLLGTLFGVVSSTSLSTLSNASPSHLSGTVSGLHESLSNLALVLGGLYVPVTSQIHLFAPFWISAASLLITLALIRPKLLFGAESKQKKE